MDDRIESEEELNLLQKVHQELKEKVELQQQAISLQEETINVQKEQLRLKDQLIAALQHETVLLTQRLQEIRDQVETDRYGSPARSSSVRFSRPPKSVLKKRHRKHG